jgi:hypothetical protein
MVTKGKALREGIIIDYLNYFSLSCLEEVQPVSNPRFKPGASEYEVGMLATTN